MPFLQQHSLSAGTTVYRDCDGKPFAIEKSRVKQGAPHWTLRPYPEDHYTINIHDSVLRERFSIVRIKSKTSRIITLCGSARFERFFHAWNKALTVSGHTVFTLTAFPSVEGDKNWYAPNTKHLLDRAHFRKIQASDGIFVLNRNAYIGESTLREITFARHEDKKVYFLESWGRGCGIGASHNQEARNQIKEDNIPAGYRSPINTSLSRANKSYVDLLPNDPAHRQLALSFVSHFDT